MAPGKSSLLPHRAVKAVVIELGLRGQVRLEHLYLVAPQEFVNRIFRILQVGQLARARGAVFAAGRGQSLGDAVIAERALLRHVLFRMQKATSIRARLYAV